MEIQRIEPFLRSFDHQYFERVRERTRRVVLCVPPDRLEWTYKPGAFTFGDLVRHLGAIERWMFAENALCRPSRYPGHGPELAAGYDAVLAYFDRMHEESMAIFRGLTPEDLDHRCETPGGAKIQVWKWLRSMVEHEIHHRGQIYLMLGMLDVPTPPLYGLTSEEVRERSVGSS
ncbi:MAG: DinB family protein [Thermoanaerobaculia bacterium]